MSEDVRYATLLQAVDWVLAELDAYDNFFDEQGYAKPEIRSRKFEFKQVQWASLKQLRRVREALK